VRLYPAIDILDGTAVRLVKGDFAAKRTYEQDPLSAALAFTEAGAKALHVVDLDGARSGQPVNLEHLGRIASRAGVPVQYGGGLRSAQAIERALAAGASRVILGTAALTNPTLLREALAAHGPERVLVSVDTRGGLVTSSGWTETGSQAAGPVLESLIESGVGEVVYTDVDRDGMLEGPDLESFRELIGPVQARVIYSGGIGHLSDLRGLAALGLANLDGVIVGKALYERRFTVPEAIEALAASS
jgi:phosphoribosylformimino-5-aminoimidazole carboxamide ribotide isomerase